MGAHAERMRRARSRTPVRRKSPRGGKWRDGPRYAKQYEPLNERGLDQVQHALALAATGYPVFPVVTDPDNPAFDKRTRIKTYWLKATTDPRKIERWGGIWNDCMIGSPLQPGDAVIDLDAPKAGRETHGVDALKALETQHDALLETVETITAGGGRHLWYRVEREIKCTSGLIGPGIDTRGSNKGFVVMPGSVTRDGRIYRWADGKSPNAIAVAELDPRHPILRRVLAPKRRARPAGRDPLAVVLDELGVDPEDPDDDVANAVAVTLGEKIGQNRRALPGCRNTTLNATAWHLGRFAATGLIAPDRAQRALDSAIECNGLATEGDGPRALKSAFAAGQARGGMTLSELRRKAAWARSVNPGHRPAQEVDHLDARNIARKLKPVDFETWGELAAAALFSHLNVRANAEALMAHFVEIWRWHRGALRDSYERLAKVIGTSRDTVRRWVRTLRALGLLSVNNERRRWDNSQAVNEFVPLLPAELRAGSSACEDAAEQRVGQPPAPTTASAGQPDMTMPKAYAPPLDHNSPQGLSGCWDTVVRLPGTQPPLTGDLTRGSPEVVDELALPW